MIPELAAPRAIAETTLTDSCQIRRVNRTAPRTVDPVTLAIIAGPDVVVWAGPCSVSPAAAGDGRTTAGGIDGLLDTHMVRLPARADGIIAGDAVTVTAIGARGDPSLLGRTFTVRSVDTRTTLVLRRLTCVELGAADGVPT